MKKNIVGILICMLLITTVLPVSGNVLLERTSISTLFGGILYVGGSGPGNYSTIQEAIDNASDGDTVFVYDDSSPYDEDLLINKSINLTGEDRDTTVIDGSDGDVVVFVSANLVDISGFTIQSGYSAGIYINRANYINITGNIIDSNVYYGISVHHSKSNTLTGNYISNNTYGIWLTDSNYNNINNNKIINNIDHGLCLQESSNNTISGNYIKGGPFQYASCTGILLIHSSNYNTLDNNTITNYDLVCIAIGLSNNNIVINNSVVYNNGTGIKLLESCFNEFFGNTISNNNKEGIGIYYHSNENWIYQNDFIENGKHAYFDYSVFNQWDKNYWDNWIGLKFKILSRIPKIILGKLYSKILDREFYWVNFDWHPAQEPYDIPRVAI